LENFVDGHTSDTETSFFRLTQGVDLRSQPKNAKNFGIFFFLSKVEKTFRCGIHNWASCYF